MKETRIEKRFAATTSDKGQYALAFGVIAVMLYAVGFPVFILFFFGVLAFFVWKAFSYESRNETRQIFQFYLVTNEIIRDDGRRWYGFEIKEAVAGGEALLKTMVPPPPLVHFGLGALYQKLGDDSLAIKHLELSVGENGADEIAIVYPTKELREYVRVLRKIERTPGDSPLTSSAVRSLERSRKNRGREMLEKSRESLAAATPQIPGAAEYAGEELGGPRCGLTYDFVDVAGSKKVKEETISEPHSDRQTISEVLHDIYDRNIS